MQFIANLIYSIFIANENVINKSSIFILYFPAEGQENLFKYFFHLLKSNSKLRLNM